MKITRDINGYFLNLNVYETKHKRLGLFDQ
ncbi:hypothetical protein KOSB73_260403 [Klebsiella grimontii]|uniref:Uncharacterized protein n=1 Tax=Klebsiella grimontii TaxID=2058152 RepID=A0A285B3Y8_9ENTR|nr:hypothetical protein KOSB73_260403 [Klebsiella grimontii]